MAANAATNAPQTRQPDDREQKTHEQNATDACVKAACTASVEPVAHGAVPRRIECC